MPRRRQKIWITRAQPGADATAERVRALGHEAIVAPLLAVKPLADVDIDLRGVAALAFTSANGVRAFADKSPRRDLTVFAVGPATAEAAKTAGFGTIETADGDSSALAAKVAATLKPDDGPLLHVAGSVAAGDLAGDLRGRGYTVERVALYDAEPAAALSAGVVADLKAHKTRIPSFRKTRNRSGLMIAGLIVFTLLVLRALVKYLDRMSDEAIVGLNIPTGVPLVYELDSELRPVRHYYLGDPEAVAKAAAAVAAQGKVK